MISTIFKGPEQTTELRVPGYRFREADGIGDYKIADLKNGGKSLTLKEQATAVLVFDKEDK